MDLWSSLEVTPTKDLDIFVANFFKHLNKKVLNDKGDRAIHIAASMGNLPILDSLLRHGVETDVINVCKATPLHLALRSQSEKVVDKLLDYSDTSLFMLDDAGYSPLHIALYLGLEDISVKLIEKSQITLSITDPRGMLPLQIAAARCLPAALQKILQRSGDMNVNQRVEAGCTALKLAFNPSSHASSQNVKPSEEKQTESLRIMLRHGADVTQIIGALNEPALHVLAFRGKTDLLKEIRAPWEGIVNMQYVPQSDAPSSASMLQAEWLGATPLFFAVAGDKLETVEYLLEKGANPNIEVFLHSSPERATSSIWVALLEKHLDIFKALLRCGASPDFKCRGRTMLHYVIDQGSAQSRSEIVKLLLAHNADIHLRDEQGMLPLVRAAIAGCIGSLNALWDAHAKLKIPEVDALDALLGACRRGHHSCVVFLHAKGVDINQKTQEGYTPLHFAAGYGRHDVVNVLLLLGADRTIVAPTRQEPFAAVGTAEAIARTFGHIKTADLIKGWGL